MTLPPRPFLAPLQPLAPQVYSPTSALSPAFNVGLTSAGVGLFVSAIKNSLDTHSKGAMGVFTRTGWIVGYFGEPSFGLKEDRLASWRGGESFLAASAVTVRTTDADSGTRAPCRGCDCDCEAPLSGDGSDRVGLLDTQARSVGVGSTSAGNIRSTWGADQPSGGRGLWKAALAEHERPANDAA